VRACTGVTSDGMGGAVSHLPAAACPFVRACTGVTSDGMGGAVSHLPAAACRFVRACTGVTSDGRGGTVPSGDENGVVVVVLGSRWGAACSGTVSSFRGWGVRRIGIGHR
jgi:hypothetical protein